MIETKIDERDLVFHGVAIKRHAGPAAIADLIGLPEARVADKPVCVAFVIVIASDGAAPTEAALRAQLRESLAAFKVPARIWVVTQFPVTDGANGTKVQRATLRKMAAERLLSDA